MFCIVKDLGLCPERSFRRKLTRVNGCVIMPLQRIDWKEGKWKARQIHKFSLCRMWV